MAERNRDGWEPAPVWMELETGMRLTVDERRSLLQGRCSELEVDESAPPACRARAAAKANAATASGRASRQRKRPRGGRSITGTRYADEAEGAG